VGRELKVPDGTYNGSFQGDESFQATNCAGSDQKTQNNRETIRKNTENYRALSLRQTK